MTALMPVQFSFAHKNVSSTFFSFLQTNKQSGTLCTSRRRYLQMACVCVASGHFLQRKHYILVWHKIHSPISVGVFQSTPILNAVRSIACSHTTVGSSITSQNSCINVHIMEHGIVNQRGWFNLPLCSLYLLTHIYPCEKCVPISASTPSVID